MHDRTTQRRSELVPVIVRPHRLEVILGIQIGVAEELPQVASEAVGARADRSVDDCSGRVAKLSRVVAGLDPELLQSLRRGSYGEA